MFSSFSANSIDVHVRAPFSEDRSRGTPSPSLFIFKNPSRFLRWFHGRHVDFLNGSGEFCSYELRRSKRERLRRTCSFALALGACSVKVKCCTSLRNSSLTVSTVSLFESVLVINWYLCYSSSLRFRVLFYPGLDIDMGFTMRHFNLFVLFQLIGGVLVSIQWRCWGCRA